MSRKTKLALWLVSHCETDNKREDYVKSLQKYIPVDIFGKCGQTLNDSGIGWERIKVFEKMSLNYKFYLAFENSNCHDYVTEKFYKTMGRNIGKVIF